jgi:DNA-binding Lrp family transcriptional regulator
MDEVDVLILGDLAQPDGSAHPLVDRAARASGPARRLKLDEKTVRTRVRRMEREGFIQYYQAVPHLGLWGFAHRGLFRFDAPSLATKHAALEWVQAQPTALEAFDYLGTSLVATFVAPDPVDLRTAAAGFAARFEMTAFPLGSRPLPAIGMTPDRIDWRILRALRYDARRTTRSLAQAAGVTARMAEYRLARLENSQTLSVRAVLDAQRQQGLVFYELELSVAPGYGETVQAAIRSAHGRRLRSAYWPSEDTLLVHLFGFTLAEPEDAALAALRVEGVRRATVYVQTRSVEPVRPSWIDRRIETEIGEPGPGRPRRRGGVRRS